MDIVWRRVTRTLASVSLTVLHTQLRVVCLGRFVTFSDGVWRLLAARQRCWQSLEKIQEGSRLHLLLLFVCLFVFLGKFKSKTPGRSEIGEITERQTNLGVHLLC